jgi:hypothetical protein
MILVKLIEHQAESESDIFIYDDISDFTEALISLEESIASAVKYRLYNGIELRSALLFCEELMNEIDLADDYRLLGKVITDKNKLEIYYTENININEMFFVDAVL